MGSRASLVLFSMDESRVFYHEDGYIEMVFVGIQEPEAVQMLIEETRVLLGEHGSASVLIDGQNGRILANATNYSQMMSMGKFPNLIHLYILTTTDTNNTEAIQGPSVITSILNFVLGFRPHYSSDEQEIRQKAIDDKSSH